MGVNWFLTCQQLRQLGMIFHGISTWEQILIPLKAGFWGCGGNGGTSLPKLSVDFNGGIYCSLDVSSEGFSTILNRIGAFCSCCHHTVGYEATQPELY